MRRLLAALAPTAAFVLLLLAVEGGVRLATTPIAPLDALVRNPIDQGNFEDDAHVRIFEGDATLFWKLQPNLRRVTWDYTLVTTNARGLRQRHELEPKRGFRVVTLGDSVTFGYRVPVVFPGQPLPSEGSEEPYPWLVEDALRRRDPSADVVTLAVPGYSSHQGLAWARRDLAALRPDVVTWCFGWNDVSLRAATDAQSMPTGRVAAAGRALTLRSQALLHLARRLPARAAAGGPAVERVPTPDYVANARAFVDLARSLGATPVLIAPVYRDARTFPEEAVRLRAHRDALRAFARGNGVAWVEVPALQEDGAPGNWSLFGELIHPNGDGHRILAAALLRALPANVYTP